MIQRWNLFLGLALAGVLSSLALSLILTISSHNDAAESSRTQFPENISWHASQFEMEHHYAVMAANELRQAPSEELRSQLLIRFDIFWSRFSDVQSGSLYAAMREEPQSVDMIDRVADVLTTLEPLVAESPIDDAAAHERIYRELQDLAGEIHEFTLRAVHLHNAHSSTIQRHLEGEHQDILWIFAGFAVLATLLIAVLLRERWSFRRLNDLLEQRVAERTAALLESEARLEEAQQIGRIGHWQRNCQTGEFTCSAELARIYGFASPEGVTAAALQNRVHPDDRISVAAVEALSMRDGQAQQVEFRVAGGTDEVRWAHARIVTTLDPEGRPLRITGVVQDVSAQVLQSQEQASLQEQLQQSQRMEALGHLTGGVAHDFNNMLAIIMGYTELAQVTDPVQNSSALQKQLEQIYRTSERARDLVRKLLTFSRGGESGEVRRLDVGEVLSESLGMLRPMIASTVIIETRIEPALPKVLADPVQLQQVILNLCINARDAMGPHGRMHLSARPSARHFFTCASCHMPVVGEFVEVCVEDDGPGIDPAVLGRIFEPFVSTKGVGEGSGMGLAMAHGIVHQAAGHILVEHPAAGGTRFRIMLPPSKQAAESAQAVCASTSEPENARFLNGRHVVIVDDEAALTHYLVTFFEHCGCRVSAYADSLHALAYLADHGDAVDLVISDQVMPHLTGMELAEQINKGGVRVPFIICTGYSRDLDKARLDALGVVAQLQKPVPRRELLLAAEGAIRQVRHAGQNLADA